jgi:parallel beta-helix repeat protein
VTAFTISIGKDLTILGSGYGDVQTSGGHSPAGDSIGTFLEADPATASLFSVDADLTISNVRLIGAENGIRISDSGGPDPVLSIEDCLFDRQATWAVFAEDDDSAVSVEMLDSIVDASRADSPAGGGGLYLDNLNYTVYNSEFYSQSPSAAGAGILAVNGAGVIDSSIFDGNGLGIWASGGSPVITSCNITGAAYTTEGINLTGGPGVPILRRNIVLNNSGYGVRIGGSATPVLFRNIISGNEEAGVLIDFSGASGDVGDIVLGDQTNFDTGFNDIYDNIHPIQAGNTEVYVTTDTPFSLIPVNSHNNYWGVDIDSAALINARIYDNKRTPADDRAIVDPSPYRIDPQNF